MTGNLTLADFQEFRGFLASNTHLSHGFTRLQKQFHSNHREIGLCYDCIDYYQRYYSDEAQLQGPGAPTKYPYDEWFDGRTHRINRREHFPNQQSAVSFRDSLRHTTRKRGLKLHSKVYDGDDEVVFKVTRFPSSRPHRLITDQTDPVEPEAEGPVTKIRTPRAMR